MIWEENSNLDVTHSEENKINSFNVRPSINYVISLLALENNLIWIYILGPENCVTFCWVKWGLLPLFFTLFWLPCELQGAVY